MKIISIIITISSLFCILLCGCNKKEENFNEDIFAENPFDVHNTAITYEFGIENYDAIKRIIDYYDTINVDFTFSNKDVPCEVGTMIFVNGMVQPYNAENYENITILPVSIGSNEKKIVSVKFNPSNLECGKTVPVHFISVLNPSFMPEKESVSYGNNLKILQLFPYKLTPSKDTLKSDCKICNLYEKEIINQDFAEEYIIYDDYGNIKQNRLENEVFLKPIIQNSDYDNCISNHEIIKLQAFGGKECIYRISMFINNTLVENTFDGMPYIDMQLNSNEICSKKIILENINMELEEYNHLSFIAIPMDNDFSYNASSIIRSYPVTLRKEEK